MSNYTIPIPDYLMEAARVVDFIEERESGRWRTRLFEVTQRHFTLEMLKHEYSGKNPERIALAKAREVPPGDYVTLQRRMTPEEFGQAVRGNGLDPSDIELVNEVFPLDRRWVPVMSDTPSEIQEQAHALLNATGRVLITGLGLGCLPHALLAKPGVTHIDIVEIDPSVIELTGAYFMDPRVTIHKGDASNPRVIFPSDTHWDYAWHDIWSSIDDDNIDDDSTAEHGISYERMFELYRDRVTEQHAWAYDEALHMRDVYDREIERELEFRDRVRALPLDEQVEELYDKVMRSRMRSVWPDDKPLPKDAALVLDPEDGLRDHLRSQLEQPDFWEKMERENPARGTSPPPSMPNRHIEDANANT